jgi:threonine synthase
MSELVSTRDTNGKQISYSDALLEGLAPDGGLYVPVEYPQVSLGELKELSALSYPQLFFQIKRRLVGESIEQGDLEELARNAYSEDKFNSQNGQVVPVRRIRDFEGDIFLQNLSRGTTAAFKDMALQPLGQELNYELARRNQNLVILGATSGDTGSSAEAAIKGLERIKLFMLSPKVGMSDFQKAQMGSLTGGNIYNISIEGRFDDCQDLVKGVKKDPEFARLGAVNSINWGRISSQVPYYFSGYLQTVAQIGQEVDFVVPSGNFGNVYSGYVAKRMGLPIRRLIVATNENNVLARLIRTGIYEQSTARVTSSPSMDISKASNYERLAFDILGRNPLTLSRYMQEFEKTGKVDFKDYGVSGNIFNEIGFLAATSTHQERLETIRRVFVQNKKEVIDPHTADGVNVGLRLRTSQAPVIVMETALPVKFEDTIRQALGHVPNREPRFLDLEGRASGGFYEMPIDAKMLKDYIRSN